MSKTKKVGILFLAFALVASVFCMLFTLTGNNVSAEETQPVWEVSETVENAFDKGKTYLMGDEIAIPEKTVTVGGQTYRTEHVLIFPDKKAYINDVITLNRAGKYVLRYTAVGADYTEETEFLVNSPLYSVYSENSFAVTGKASDYTEYEADGKSGIVASIALGDTFEYHKTIDLSGKTAKDTIINISVLPERVGTADCMRINFVFTDVYDESNYVVVAAKMCGTGIAWREQSTYVTANAVGQPETGLESKADGGFFWEGGEYKLHQNNQYGAPTSTFSFSGMQNYNAGIEANRPKVGTQELSISFDYAEKRVYLNERTIVADLDDTSLFTTLWNGFTTGEVKLSIYGESYNSSALNLLINEIDGDTSFADGFVQDTVAPEIYLKNSLEDAYAIVGKEFAIPQAETDDGSAVTVKVYKGYNTDLQTMVNVTPDGYFIPNQTREYTIEYTAVDESGNETTETLTVTAVKDKNVSVTLKEDDKSDVVGALQTVRTPEVLNASGDYTLSVDAVSDAASYHIGTYTKEQIENEEAVFEFRPLYAGEYEIVYAVKDYVSEYETSYMMNVDAEGDAVFLQEPVLPRYIIKNAVYDTPSLTATCFENGVPVEKAADVYITSGKDISEAQLYTRNIFQISEDSCFITFVCGGATVQKEIPVVDVGYGTNNLNFAKYFVEANGGEVSYSEVKNGSLVVGLEYQVKSADGNPAIDMVNYIQVFGFEFEFTVPENAGYDAFTIVLTDTQDARNVLNFEFAVENGQVKYVSDTGFKYTAAAVGERVSVSYSDSEKTITVNSQKISVNEGADGEAWNGFAEKKAYFTLSFKAAGNARIVLNKLNNQAVRITKTDTIAPQISVSSETGTRGLNAVVSLDALYAADVLSPRISFVMKAVDPDGNTVVAEDGTVLDVSADPGRDYTIKLEKYGLYMITYTAVDALGMERVYEYSFRAVDDVAPTIQLQSHTVKASVGDTVVVADSEISDDVSTAENCTLYITVQQPNGTLQKLTGNSFKVSVAGRYTVTYMAVDEAGNVGFVSYEVNAA